MSYNFHFIKTCNAKCHFCFAQFHDVKQQLSFSDQKKILITLREHNGHKINFVGGEPTLYSKLPDLIIFAKELGFVTSIVTNGFRLEKVLEKAGHCLDWVGLSIDSANDATNRKLGRSREGEDYAMKIAYLATLCHQKGIALKLNSVVTKLNWQEDMSDYVFKLRPTRWKIFQVLPIENQNSLTKGDLEISQEQFRKFIDQHQRLSKLGITLVPEDNDAMTNSYAMIDPLGRFMGNSNQIQIYSDAILDVGVQVALQQIGFQHDKLIARGGIYEWQ